MRNSFKHLLFPSSDDKLTNVRSSSSILDIVVLSSVECLTFLNEREADTPSI
jgi:hypothetical protein